MTVVLQNVKDENLNLLKELAKICKMKLVLKKDEVADDIRAFEAEDKAGKTKVYESYEAFVKAMNA